MTGPRGTSYSVTPGKGSLRESMPIYEYRCTACGEEIEIIQKISDRPRRKCKKCSGKLEKLVSRAAFHLKGGGWYAQGYGDSSSAKPETKSGAKTTGDKRDGDASGDKQEAKKETKKETKPAGASC